MTTTLKTVGAVVCLSVSALAVGLLSVPAAQGAGAPPTQSVLVVNTAGQAVPTAATGTTSVSGSVGIIGTAAVAATQSGSWNVGITGTPSFSLTLADGQTLPVSGAISIAARQIFRQQIATGSFIENPNPNVTGLPGHRLVIESVDVVDANGATAVFLLETAGGSTPDFRWAIPLKLSSALGIEGYVANSTTKIYLEPGDKLTVSVKIDPPGPSDPPNPPPFGSFFFSGYWE